MKRVHNVPSIPNFILNEEKKTVIYKKDDFDPYKEYFESEHIMCNYNKATPQMSNRTIAISRPELHLDIHRQKKMRN